MTPAEADQRIIKSRQTLHRYLDMLDAGIAPDEKTLPMIRDEIGILEGVAEAHPIKAAKIEWLVGKWQHLMRIMRRKMN